MERAVGYCLQASKKIGTSPIILIVYIESVHDSVKEKLRKCNNLPCYKACSDFWADQYYIMDKNSINDHISQDAELDPFVAFGLFMTNQAKSLNLTPRNTDPTMAMLYHMSLDIYSKILNQDIKHVNELKQLNNVCHAQYENILSLLQDDNTPRSSIIQYVSQSAKYNKQQKRKSDELATSDDSEDDAGRSKYQKADNGEQVKVPDYKERMAFIEKFRDSLVGASAC